MTKSLVLFCIHMYTEQVERFCYTEQYTVKCKQRLQTLVKL